METFRWNTTPPPYQNEPPPYEALPLPGSPEPSSHESFPLSILSGVPSYESRPLSGQSGPSSHEPRQPGQPSNSQCFSTSRRSSYVSNSLPPDGQDLEQSTDDCPPNYYEPFWIVIPPTGTQNSIPLLDRIADDSRNEPPSYWRTVSLPESGSLCPSPTLGPPHSSPTLGPLCSPPTLGPPCSSPTLGPTLLSPTFGPTLLSPTFRPALPSPTFRPAFPSPILGPPPDYNEPYQIADEDLDTHAPNPTSVCRHGSSIAEESLSVDERPKGTTLCLVISIITAIIFPLLGIFALIYSIKAMLRIHRGDYTSATKFSSRATCFNILAIVPALLLGIILSPMFFTIFCC